MPKEERDYPDMEISIEYLENGWTAEVYYPGFERKSEIICQGESRNIALKETIEFLHVIQAEEAK